MSLVNLVNSAASVDCNLVRRYLDKILNSPIFAYAPKQQKLLKYLVKESHIGNGQRLKGYTIAIEALDAKPEFDSSHNSSVRVNAKRLRENLCEYYRNLGESDEVRFHLGIGSYEIIFLHKAVNTQAPNVESVLPHPDRRYGCDRRASADRQTQVKEPNTFNINSTISSKKWA
jgi:hypothetical protein